ncbi:MAG: hypothetical protein BWK78_08215 [Thiotrichaceae bacterium IS1]|nr:MAG: hypothetical protein BWK78_08215 [Thiotrichaceae bacterium IS1]
MSKRKNQLLGEVGAFLQQYRRKAYPTHDPNDRRYDRKVEQQVKSMTPEELNEIMYGDHDDFTQPEGEQWNDGKS